MKKNKIVSLSIISILALASCKKTDLQQEDNFNQESIVAAASPSAAATGISFSKWHAVSNWSSQKEENGSIYSALLEDTSITPAVVAEGLVLVYAKNADSTTSLPAQTNNTLWYYQINNGAILLKAGVTGSSPLDKNLSFQYIVFSPAQLASLEEKGISKDQLLSFTYQEAQNILN